MSAQELANPFSTATVVVAEDYVNTFPHPQGLITYLHRLCLQLDIDIVSLERPVTVKGSWKTIIKIDAFLKTLISTLHNNAVSKGAVPNEEDFTTAFDLFEEENNYRAESLEGKHTAKAEIVTNDVSQIKADDFLEVLKFDEDDTDASLLNKWYCNSNPRKRTVVVDKYRGMCPNSEKVPPAPYVIVDADDTNKICHTSLSEIEQALTQVYKKETIEKYKQKSVNCVKLPENTAVLDDFNCSKKTVNPDSDGLSQTQLNDAQKMIISENKVKDSAENCASYSLKYVEEIMMDNELEKSEPKSYSYSEKGVAKVSSKIIQDSLSRPLEPGKKVRHKNSKRKTTPEFIENSFIVPKRKRRSSRIKRRKEICNATIEEICKASKCDDTLQRLDHKTLRHSNKTSPHQNNQEVSKSVSKLEKKVINETFQSNISAAKSKIITDTSLTPCRPTEIKNKEMRNHYKNEDLGSRNHNKKKDLDTRNHHKKELETQYYCDQCSYLTSKQLQLLEHKRRVHMTKKFRCNQCLKEFGFRKDLRRHEKCHDKANNCCDICGKMYKDIRKLMEHKRIHDNDYIKPEFPCKFCTKKFSTKYVLAYHIKSDHLGMKRSYICPTCGKSFSQKNSYFQHANVHLGIKPFSCEVCGKRFSYEKSVKEHMFMHNEEKIFLCTFCPKSFRQASGLSIHLRVHKATKDYVCSMCGKGFSQKQSLVRHERIHGGEKPYECGICQRTFADSSVLRRHMILIHKKDVKQWRQDTLCHITKRADFYISVLNGDSLHSNNFETEKANEKSPENHQQNICYQQETEEQMELEQDRHLQTCSTTARSVPQIPNTYDNVMKNSAFTNPEAPGSYTNASSADVKPYAGYSSEKPDNAINAITTVTNDVESSLFSSSSLHIHSTASLQMNNSLTVSPSHHYQTSLVTHPVQPQTNSSSFVPIAYHQRSVNYGTSNIQSVDMPHAQYSAVMAQPYAQTIVLVQDSLGTTTYHQPGVNVAYSEDSAVLNVHLQRISPSMPMSSSPMPHLTDIPQTMASKTSSNTFDQVLSPSYQQPH